MSVLTNGTHLRQKKARRSLLYAVISRLTCTIFFHAPCSVVLSLAQISLINFPLLRFCPLQFTYLSLICFVFLKAICRFFFNLRYFFFFPLSVYVFANITFCLQFKSDCSQFIVVCCAICVCINHLLLCTTPKMRHFAICPKRHEVPRRDKILCLFPFSLP